MDQPVVAIARAERGADASAVAAAVRRAVALAGGLEDVVPAGGLALIKPNLVAPPPDPLCGACTSAAVCQALADLVIERGARAVIAESSARGLDTGVAMEIMGYTRLRAQGYDVVDLKRTPTVRVPVPGGRVLSDVVTFELALQADAILSVPVMKTHDQTDVSLSLKNLKGLVTDAEKRRIHQIGVFEGVADLA
ncbi:MAG: DUF362 domain-containing protein, partial [Chloroflexota bacterium]